MTDHRDEPGPDGTPPDAPANDLAGLLTRAAGDDEPVRFDHDDVRRRAHRRARQRRGLALASILAVIALAAGVLALAGRGDGDGDADHEGVYANDDEDVDPLTAEELAGAPWVATAFSVVTIGTDGPIVPFVTFRPDGTLLTSDGCQMAEGSWQLADGRLVVDVALDDWRGEPCGDRTGLQAVLAGPPEVDPRSDDALGDLVLRTGRDFVAFDRFDRLGRIPHTDDLVGSWADTSDDDSAATFTFADDGTLRAGMGTCEIHRSWAIEDGQLAVRDDRDGDPAGNPGCGIFLPGLDHDVLDGTTPTRVNPGGEYLWLDAGGVVLFLQRPRTEPGSGPPDGPATTAIDGDGQPTAATEPADRPEGPEETGP